MEPKKEDVKSMSEGKERVKSTGSRSLETTESRESNNGYVNTERKNAITSFVLMVVGIAVISFPIMTKADMMNWGYASIYVGGLLTAASLLSFWIFVRRAKVRGEMLSGKKVLAHWVFSGELKEKHRKEELENKKDSRVAGLVLGGILFVIGLVFLIADPQENKGFFLLITAIAAAMASIIFLVTGRYTKRLLREQSTVTFHPKGVYYRGNLIHWDGLITRLESVLLDPSDSGTLVIVFNQLVGRRIFRGRHVLKIPIPEGKEQEAFGVISSYDMPANEVIMEHLKDIEGKYE